MLVITPQVFIEDNIDGDELLKKIEKSGRTCYQSEDKITVDSAREFVAFIIKRGHDSVIEHEKVTVRIICDRGCCYSDDTKVLTENGWKFFKDLKASEKVASKTDDGEMVFLEPEEIISEYYKGDMVSINTTQVSFLVTPNHNMWVEDYHKRSIKSKIWKFIEARDLKNSKYKFSKGIELFNGVFTENIYVPSVIVKRGFYEKEYDGKSYKTDLFMKFLGVWIMDGSLSDGKGKGGNRIIITQTKDNGRKYIESVLSSLDIKYTYYKNDYRICNPSLYNFLYKNFIKNGDFNKTYYISIPKWIKDTSKEHLSCLLEGMLVGNGTPHTKGKGYQIYMGSESLAEDIVEIAIKCGKAASLYIKNDRVGFEHDGIKHKIPEIYVSIVSTKDTLFNKNVNTYKFIPYDGKVYCVKLPYYHRLMVMRNGKACWCGNSHEVVRHRIGSYSQECVSGDTVVKKSSKKQITIKDLYDKTHKINLKSVNDKGIVVPNKFIDVFYKGIADLYEVVSERGYVLKCTLDHEFKVGKDSYKKLRNLLEGNEVLVSEYRVGTVETKDLIKSIKYVGKGPVYDLEMKAPYHNYVANGFITHNSTRYVNYSKGKFGSEIKVIDPCFWSIDGKVVDKVKYEVWKEAMLYAEKAYMKLIELGASPQEARSVLPNSLKTEIVVTYNLREWRHFFKLRTSKAAHPQMREVACMLLELFREKIPVVFDEI